MLHMQTVHQATPGSCRYHVLTDVLTEACAEDRGPGMSVEVLFELLGCVLDTLPILLRGSTDASTAAAAEPLCKVRWLDVDTSHHMWCRSCACC